LWAANFGADPNITLSHAVIARASDVTFRIFDVFTKQIDHHTQRGFYTEISRGWADLFNGFSANKQCPSLVAGFHGGTVPVPRFKVDCHLQGAIRGSSG
jgi:hypothetical protein